MIKNKHLQIALCLISSTCAMGAAIESHRQGADFFLSFSLTFWVFSLVMGGCLYYRGLPK